MLHLHTPSNIHLNGIQRAQTIEHSIHSKISDKQKFAIKWTNYSTAFQAYTITLSRSTLSDRPKSTPTHDQIFIMDRTYRHLFLLRKHTRFRPTFSVPMDNLQGISSILHQKIGKTRAIENETKETIHRTRTLALHITPPPHS